MSVYKFSRNANEYLTEFLNLFRCESGTARQKWAALAEVLMEPIGWEAVWKLSKKFCKMYEVRYPCVAFVSVISVDLDELTACVSVLCVQLKSITLPESVVDVPLVELWPTLKQREPCINACTTADFIDKLRFYYNEIWMPWDDEDKEVLPETVEGRMELWSEIQSGAIDHFVARSIVSLRNTAIYVNEQLRELDSSIRDEDIVIDGDKMVLCAELNAKLDTIMAKWALFETTSVREPYVAKLHNKWKKQKGQNPLVAVWQGGDCEELNRIAEYINSRKPQRVAMVTTAEEGLAMQPDELLICSRLCEMPEVPITQTSITGILPNATIISEEMQFSLLSLTGPCKLAQLSLQCQQVNTAVFVWSGSVELNNCTITINHETGVQSDIANGIHAMEGSRVLLENCTITNFYTGIIVNEGAEVELRGCKIKNCGVGIQMCGGRLKLANTLVAQCREHCIRCDVYTGTAHTYKEVEGLQIQADCIIGSGNLETEISLVPQELDLM